MNTTFTPSPRAHRAIRLTPAERGCDPVREGFTADDVLCPFFHRFRHLSICCEGVTDTSSLQLTFRCKKDLEQQAGLFCVDRWKNCEIARMLDARYD